MTVDYRSLFVRVQRRMPNHLTPTHTLGPPCIGSTGSYDTSYCNIRSPGRRNMVTRLLGSPMVLRVTSVMLPWEFRVNSEFPAVLPWTSVGHPWDFRWTSVGLPSSYGTSVGLPWCSHGNSAGLPRASMRLPWDY